MTVESISSFAPLAAQYDAFILDLWGVIHDGQKLYPGAKECLKKLRAADKKIVLLSNAPRRASSVAEVLLRMGIAPDAYDALITSGETAYRTLADSDSSYFQPKGKRYVYIGLEKDRRLLQGLPYQETSEPSEAYFLLLSHSFYDNQPEAELAPLLERCFIAKLPALCINPDMEVVRQSGERVYCAGLIAQQYAAKGGEVVYFGKPRRIVYEASFKILSGIDPARILAVGDNLATDILGAHDNGIRSAFVTGGIFHKMLGDSNVQGYEANCEALFAQEGIAPNYVISAFNW